MRRRKAQRHIDHGALTGERSAGLEAIGRQRHLDGDIARDLRQLAAFGEHCREIERSDLRAHRSGNDCADLAYDVHEVASSLGDERRIGSDAVNESGCGEVGDLGEICGVDEKFHTPCLGTGFVSAGLLGAATALL